MGLRLADASIEEKSDLSIDFSKYHNALEQNNLSKDIGVITGVTGFLLKGYLPGACVGALVKIIPSTLSSQNTFMAEVVGFKDENVLFMALGEMRGVGLGARIELVQTMATVNVGDHLLGRVVNALGEPIDGKGDIEFTDERPIYSDIVNPMSRPPIDKSLDLGVRAINGLLTVGEGQRVGIMAGSGVGKSMLLGMIAKGTEAEVNVIALIGERGREVREFIENDLGEEGLKRSIVVVATSNESPLVRMRGAFLATSIAEYFSEQSKSTLLMMDSITRFAMAQREVGLSIGEPPASKGYTPSVFAMLPKLLERAGTFDAKGSITGLYTVLVEGDDMDDPIADSVRSIVDGHIVLDRKLAQKGHFPAIDVLQSASRVMKSVVPNNHMELAARVRENIATYREAEDLINIGAYTEGSSAKIDQALHAHEGIELFLRQNYKEIDGFETTVEKMNGLGV